MTASRTARGLLEAACTEYTNEILPQLPPSQRYAGAMLRRALEVLRAGVAAAEPPEAVFEHAGLGTAAELAAALRRRDVPDGPALRRVLRSHVELKLEISNPRFLEETRAATERRDR